MKSNLFELLIICGFILVVIWYYKKTYKPTEGFQQNERFLLKTNQDTYDGFYSEIYDELWKPENRVNYEVDLLINTLQPDPKFSRMLDVGSGTGTFLKELNKKKFNVRGIDMSKSMSQKGIEKHNFKEGVDITIGDVMDPMVYDRADFTHIFCMDFTLYELEDKRQFFKNCYYWLENNGYLVLHLAERTQFNAIVPAAQPPVLDSIEQLGPNRIVKTEIEFEDFVYTSDYITDNKKVVHKESFTDKQTQNIRQNERTLVMDSSEDILKMALAAGFIAQGSFTLVDGPRRDAAQQIVILSRGT
jgi:SAM-dependent methyltransferase